jgi:hypothetical protein
MSVKARVSKKIGEKTLRLRDQLWPDIPEEDLWHRKRNKGFTTIPRSMTYVVQVMNELANNMSLSLTYLSLWCHTYDEYMVTIADPRRMAFEAGFIGQRPELTWNKRMKKLIELGFIKAEAGPSGPFNYILILNPLKVVKNKRAEIRKELYNALLQRANDIGADDLQ